MTANLKRGCEARRRSFGSMRHSIPGRHIEIFFADADRVVDLDIEDEDSTVATAVVEAIQTDDPDVAERELRDAVAGTVKRRP